MSCGACGDTGWKVTRPAPASESGFDLAVDLCDCTPLTPIPEGMVERLWAAVVAEIEVVTGKRPSLDAALGRAYTENALLRAELHDVRGSDCA